MSEWYAVPDATRESWGFLQLTTETDEAQVWISGWKTGYGNPLKLVRTNSETGQSPADEPKLLEQLLEDLEPRRYSGMTLITPNRYTINLLRTHLLSISKSRYVTLRGFRYLPLNEILHQHFVNLHAQHLSLDYDADWLSNDNYTIRELWAIRKEIGLLVPTDVLQGTPL